MQFTHAGFRQSTDLQNMIRSAHFNDCEESDKSIDHFTVSCLVAWPLNESEAGGDLVLIETFLLFSC